MPAKNDRLLSVICPEMRREKSKQFTAREHEVRAEKSFVLRVGEKNKAGSCREALSGGTANSPVHNPPSTELRQALIEFSAQHRTRTVSL